MKQKLIFLIMLLIGVKLNFAQISVTATSGTSPASYTTLKGVFDAINAGTHRGVITIIVTANTTEGTAAIALNASGSGSASYSSVSIKPSGGARSITAATTAGSATIDLNGADNVTIDGLNTGGNSLTISNTTVSATAGTCTIRFQADATNNTITNCSVLGSSTMPAGTNGGNIWFGSGTTTGNDGNTISNCDIGPAGSNLPAKGISFTGLSNTDPGSANSGITITNNNIFDYFLATNSSVGIDVQSGTTSITISNNKLYQTALRTQSTGVVHRAISINNSSGNNYQIIGNTIGYSSSNGTGKYSFSGPSSSAQFSPIYITAGTTTATSVQGNTIAGIAVSGAINGSSTSIAFACINVAGGLVNIGTVSGNTIGSMTDTSSITYTSSSSSASDVVGIFRTGTNNWVTNNNNIGGIKVSSTGTGAANFYGLRSFSGSTNTWTCNNNTVGGTVANSINSTSTATGTIVGGISDGGTSGPIGNFKNNTIRNMTVAGGTGTGFSASMMGMVMSNVSNDTLTGNIIYNLSNTNTSAATVVSGITMIGSTANLVEGNLIYGLTSATNNTSAQIDGIRTASATTTVYKNNMIILGIGVTNAIGTGVTGGISGINETLGTNKFYHNSVYIGGSPTTGVGPSFAFNSIVTTNTRDFRNNIFVNERSNNGATGKNYAVRVGGTTVNPAGLTINNNVYYGTGTGFVFGYFNSADVANLAAWKTAVGQDAISQQGNPQFTSPTAATPDLHISTSATSIADTKGIDVGVTNDFDGQTRSTLSPVDIGADAFCYTTTSTTTQSACNSYTWNGVTYTTNGTYTKTFTSGNSVGCDSIATLNLTIRNTTTSTTNIAICAPQAPYIWNGTSYSSTGVYTKLFTNSIGCDSIATLNLIVKNCDAGALNFDGVNDYVTVPYNAGLNPSQFSVQCWVKASASPTFMPLITARDDNSIKGYSLYFHGDSKWAIWIGDGSNQKIITSVAKIALDTWTQLTGTYDGTTVRLYVNGILVASTTTSFSANTINPLLIGTHTNYQFNAKATMDEVRIWNRALSQTEITNNMSCELFGTQTGLAAYYHFNQGSFNTNNAGVTTLTDASGNNRNGTLTNFSLNGTTSNWITHSFSNISSCSNYTWNGVTYTTSGTYIKMLTNSKGCDSLVGLILTINQPTASTSTISSCGNYVWSGTTYITSGTYTKTFTNAAGCDSVATINLTIYPNASYSSVNVAYNSQPYIWNGLSFTQTTTKTLHFTSTAGCDSTATLDFKVLGGPAYSLNFSQATGNCVTLPGSSIIPKLSNGQVTISAWVKIRSYSQFGTIIKNWGSNYESGVFNFGLNNSGQLRIYITPANGGYLPSITSPNQLSLNQWHNVAFSADGQYLTLYEDGVEVAKTTYDGTLKTDFLKTRIGANPDDSIYGSGQYWDGWINELKIWNKGMQACQIVANMNCYLSPNNDSTLLAYYKFNQGIDNANNSSITTLIDSSGNANNGTLQNFTLNSNTSNWSNDKPLNSFTYCTPNAVSIGTASLYLCSDQYPYSFKGKSITSPSIYNIRTSTYDGCNDSMIVLTVTTTTKYKVKLITNSNFNSSTYSISYGGYTYASTSDYSVSSYLANGDSVTLCGGSNLLFNFYGTSQILKKVIIDGVNINIGNNATAYNLIMNNRDHIVEVIWGTPCASSSSSTTNLSICPNQFPYTWNGLTFNTVGSKTARLTTVVNYCDSFATLNLSLSANYIITATASANGSINSLGSDTICSGSSKQYTFTANAGYAISDVIVDGVSIGAVSSYTFTNVASNHTISVSFISGCVANLSTTNISICPSELPYTWNGLTFVNGGSQTAHLTNACGSDSAATLNLTINATSSSVTNLTIYSNQVPYSWNGQIMIASGTTTAHLTNIKGCDSVATLNLTVIMNDTTTIKEEYCSNKSPFPITYYYFADYDYVNYQRLYITSAGTYSKHVVGSMGQDSFVVIIITLNPIPAYTVDTTICRGSLPFTYRGNTYTVEGSYTLTALSNYYAVCDTTVTLNIFLKEATAATINITVASFPYLWNGVSYNTAGTYSRVLVNSIGCDSNVTLNLFIGAQITGANITQSTISNTCYGTPITFTVSPIINFSSNNAMVTHKWLKNDQVVSSIITQISSTSSYTDTTLRNTDKIECWIYATPSSINLFANDSIVKSNAIISSNVITPAQFPYIEFAKGVLAFASSSINASAGERIKEIGGFCNTGDYWIIHGTDPTNGTWVADDSGVLNVSSFRTGFGSKYYQIRPTGKNGMGYAKYTYNYNGCTMELIAKVPSNSTNPISPVQIASGTNTLCIGGKVDLYINDTNGVWRSNTNGFEHLGNGVFRLKYYYYSTFSGFINPSAEYGYNIPMTAGSSQSCYRAQGISFPVPVGYPTPLTTPITGSTNKLCIGNSVKLSNAAVIPVNGSSFWESTAGRVSVDATGNVTATSQGTANIRYTVYEYNGCGSVANYSITVNPLPTTPTASYLPYQQIRFGANGMPGIHYCKGISFTIAGNPGNGIWTKTGSSINISPNGVKSTNTTITTVQNGAASVTYTIKDSASGCSNARTFLFDVLSGTLVGCANNRGIKNDPSKFNSEQFTIYPNPAHSTINIKLNTLVGEGTIVVTDLYGKQIKQQALSLGTNTIDVSGFAKGMYLVSVITEQGKQTQKVIVE